MTDAPERIWATADIDVSAQITDVYAQATPDGFVGKPAEYLRADLVPDWSSDMEAAPKDGTRILTFHPACPGAIIERARRDNWVVNEWRGIGWYWSLPEQPPIAWMPIPAPPKGETR